MNLTPGLTRCLYFPANTTNDRCHCIWVASHNPDSQPENPQQPKPAGTDPPTITTMELSPLKVRWVVGSEGVGRAWSASFTPLYVVLTPTQIFLLKKAVQGLREGDNESLCETFLALLRMVSWLAVRPDVA